VLTSQLFFPDEPANASDGIFNPDLVVEMIEQDGDDEALTAVFNFVVETA
jgi:protocatechuate 3,4-dioxygenase beta subunit